MRDNIFDLSSKVIVITGAAGLLGEMHADAIAGFGGCPILIDRESRFPNEKVHKFASTLASRTITCKTSRFWTLTMLLNLFLTVFGFFWY